MKSSILETNLKIAKLQAERSYAKRLKVGAVLTRDDRVISSGWNGTPRSFDNNCEVKGKTRPEVIHAETNAIAYAAKDGISTNGATLVITHSPCYECAKLIVQSGIHWVFYETEYRVNGGIELLEACGVGVRKIEL